MEKKQKNRIESDSMGEVSVPEWAYWGAQTQRAIHNFQFSDKRIPEPMIRALAYIKKHAAYCNARFGLVDDKLAKTIARVCDEILAGNWDRHFPIDVFQTGSGTSWNMNINEVIANRGNEILGSPKGTRNPIHPNDHVNRGQSSNDVIPTAVHIANRIELPRLHDALEELAKMFSVKEKEYASCMKLGRTHLQDAVPMTFGQELSAFRTQIEKVDIHIQSCYSRLEELAIGGTAVGTGINTHPQFRYEVAKGIANETDIPFRSADNLFEVIAMRDAQVALMGALNTLAGTLMKIVNDLRLLASGPRAALGEVILPSLQPGSSIMPGKVNPVIPEAIIQAAAYVHGKVLSVTIAGQQGPLQLNMMHPLIAYETLTSIDLLTRVCHSLAKNCVKDLKADEQRMKYWIDWSLALVTPLALKIGYDKAAQLAYSAYKQKKHIKEILKKETNFTDREIEDILNPEHMIDKK
ncbi:hypothetical protein LSH36_583g01252 [Paralvinella palmiformis]|uniref:Fumarate hydratase n=1 Tax=Paralvinella palmiformis TaxID=53620 RepID=A0AAD9J5H5_9ANNE|nr:hypothetical protein LSH36_583g01252 [Paralvinella palmiformis]